MKNFEETVRGMTNNKNTELSLWARNGKLIERVHDVLNGKSHRHSGQPAHGQHMPEGWVFLGCIGTLSRGNARYANCQCLELATDGQGMGQLLVQYETGDFSGHDYGAYTVGEPFPLPKPIGQEHQQKIRRRVEDHLRKASLSVVLRTAHLLGVRTD